MRRRSPLAERTASTRTGRGRGVGCVTQVKEQGACIARNALIAADWPEDVTGQTINRFCGSGLEAINDIAGKIGAGFVDGAIGRGVESMSRVPMGSDGAMIDGLNEKLRKTVTMVPQGISADLIATLEGISRADVDAFALASQQKAARAIEQGRFSRSLFVAVDHDGKPLTDKDEHPRPDTTLESLGQLAPAFEQMGAMAVGPNGETLDQLALKVYPKAGKINHVHTAGNSSGIVDGACAVLVGSKEFGAKISQKPRARIRAMARGSRAGLMLTAPAPASKRALISEDASRNRPVGYQRGLRVVPLQTSARASIPTGERQRPARSRWATRWAQPGHPAQHRAGRAGADQKATASSRCASAAAWHRDGLETSDGPEGRRRGGRTPSSQSVWCRFVPMRFRSAPRSVPPAVRHQEPDVDGQAWHATRSTCAWPCRWTAPWSSSTRRRAEVADRSDHRGAPPACTSRHPRADGLEAARQRRIKVDSCADPEELR